MSKTKLTRIQRALAKSLFIARPGVLPGTRVIPGTKKREAWYAKVREAMIREKVPDACVREFCDIAGVPD